MIKMTVGVMSFAGSTLLIIAILLGVVATVLTYLNSRKLKGEIFEKPFIYFASGMLLITFSLFNVTFLQYALNDLTVSLLHDLSFIVGLALMLIASMKLTKFLTKVEDISKKAE
jgi:hypothetical protein